MTEEETEIILEKLNAHMMGMDKLIHWQRAAINGLREFVVETSGVDRDEAMQRISQLTRQSYDRAMTSLGEGSSAGYVEQVDIRKDMPDGDSDFWMFP
jgi:hypothetical protein